jgi:hypothetical protein
MANGRLYSTFGFYWIQSFYKGLSKGLNQRVLNRL